MVKYLFVTVALLHIALGEKKVETVIGIDLGTTYSCVGVWLNGKVEILANELGNRKTPNWVSFTDVKRLIGDAAQSQVSLNPQNTLYDMKRLIGRKFDDVETNTNAKFWPFKLISKDKKPSVQVEVKGEKKTFAPEEILAMVLRKMKNIAEKYLGKPVKSAVITCPVSFNNAQRQAIKDAAVISGLNVLRVLDEATAAAIAYGIRKKYKKEQNVLIYDLGGGGFDVSLMQISDGVFEVLATSGDTHLGGEDFDQRIMSLLLKIWQKKTGFDVSHDARCVQKLRREVEKAKCELSSNLSVVIELDNFFEGQNFRESLTRARFEELNGDLFRSTIKHIMQVLKDSNLNKTDVDKVVMVGGSSRIPRIQALVKDYFDGKELEKEINPDEAVAYGAAIQAALLGGEPVQMMDEDTDINRTPLTVGIETVDGVMLPLIEKGTIIPWKKSRVFSIVNYNQKCVLMEVDKEVDKVSVSDLPPCTPQTSHLLFKLFEGEHTKTKDNRELGEFRVDITCPHAQCGKPQLELSVDIDADSIMHVTAEKKVMDSKESITIAHGDWRLTEDEIMRLVNEANGFGKDQVNEAND